MVVRPSIRKFECSSCKYTDYRMSSRDLEETIPGACPRCGGNLAVTGDGISDSLAEPLDLVLKNFDVTDMVALQSKIEFEVSSLNPKKSFRSLLKSLKRHGYVPVLRQQDGGLKLLVVKQPPIKTGRIWINIALLIITIISTFVAWYFYFDNSIFNAALFSAAIMIALGSHELGHKLLASESGVAATMPYFIPAPTSLGTFGAVISIRSPIPTKEALVKIGAAGPLVGFVLSVVVTSIGLSLALPGAFPLTFPFLPGMFALLQLLALGHVSATVLINPLVFAGWVAMFVTVFNLLPAGQLDGGHIARSLMSRQQHHLLTQVIGFLMVALGLLYPDYPFWVWGFMIIFFFRYQHPGALDDVSPLGGRHKLLALLALLVFILCLPLPIG